MKDEQDLIPRETEEADDSESVASNIERYLNNHTREGGHAWQMNMAARPEAWQPLELSPEPPTADNSRT